MNQTTTHTPGPWNFEGRYNGITEHTGPISAGKHTICHVELDRPDEGGEEQALPELEANARLIAAAPDLLAVVKEAVQAYAINEGQEDDEIDYTRLNNALLKGKQAIAKAEGRE